jgi:hypothetical protein
VGLGRDGGFEQNCRCNLPGGINGIFCRRMHYPEGVPARPGSRHFRATGMLEMIAGHLLLLASLIECAARVRGHFQFYTSRERLERARIDS